MATQVSQIPQDPPASVIPDFHVHFNGHLLIPSPFNSNPIEPFASGGGLRVGSGPSQRFRLSGAFSVFSILIFMALKNSKTGSLPVSEIYNFMTEHFPYFKVSPRFLPIPSPPSPGQARTL